jgi:hypothetical protein
MPANFKGVSVVALGQGSISSFRAIVPSATVPGDLLLLQIAVNSVGATGWKEVLTPQLTSSGGIYGTGGEGKPIKGVLPWNLVAWASGYGVLQQYILARTFLATDPTEFEIPLASDHEAAALCVNYGQTSTGPSNSTTPGRWTDIWTGAAYTVGIQSTRSGAQISFFAVTGPRISRFPGGTLRADDWGMAETPTIGLYVVESGLMQGKNKGVSALIPARSVDGELFGSTWAASAVSLYG